MVILQPGYLPWLGFFNQMLRSDIFVYYDDVQYDKHGWRNRNRVKTPQGPHWLTVPVLHRGRDQPLNSQMLITPDQKWAKKHLGTIAQFYRKAPFFETYYGKLEILLQSPWEKLVDLNLATTAWLCEEFGIIREIYKSSELGIGGGQTERLVSLCRHFGATEYLSGSAARDYLEVPQFQAAGIEVCWHDYKHPNYSQQFGEFVPFLSSIDLLFNIGPDSIKFLT